MRVKFLWINHMHKYQKSKQNETCPWLYAIESETIKKLMNKKITRENIKDIEKKKWLVNESGNNIYKIKEEIMMNYDVISKGCPIVMIY